MKTHTRQIFTETVLLILSFFAFTPLLASSYPQLEPTVSGHYDPSLPQWTEWRKRNAADAKWEWKVPVAFYGRVLDQNDSPVARAKVTLSIADLSADGTSIHQLLTNEQGEFSLKGVQGKQLLIRSIEKAGFKYGEQKQDVFEYAAFFESNYHRPDSKNPVTFRLHQASPLEPLIVIEDKYRITPDNTVSLNLKTGRPGDDLIIQLTDNSDPTGRHWSATVKAKEGLQVALEQFSNTAPETGYLPEIALNQDTVQPEGFQSGSLYKGGRFYVRTNHGYALVDFRMVPGNKSLRLTSYLNPNPKSRNLEVVPR